jgi:hypothetical protein
VPDPPRCDGGHRKGGDAALPAYPGPEVRSPHSSTSPRIFPSPVSRAGVIACIGSSDEILGWRRVVCLRRCENERNLGTAAARGRVNMASSNAWAEFAALFRSTREAFLDHERAKTELKGLMPPGFPN